MTATLSSETEPVEAAGTAAVPAWLAGLLGPVAVAATAAALVLALVVGASRSAWTLLGVGRGAVPEAWYPVSGFVVVLATTFGQAAGWAAASALLYYLMTLVGPTAGWGTARLVMSVAYLGLAGLPSLVFHGFFGQWLLGLPRTGLVDWLATHYPDAHWLLIRAHPFIDLALIPLGLVFLGLLWGAGDTVRHSRAAQTVAALALLGTSLALALSMAIHSTLVHIRL